MNKNAGISTLKGIGEKTEKLFLKLGVESPLPAVLATWCGHC